jgi:hypothetical protein
MKNPYADGYRKAVPPPPVGPQGEVGVTGTPGAVAAATKTKVARKARMGLDTFTYNCHSCGAIHAHSSGYLFVIMLDEEQLYFCDHNCCDAFEKGYTKPGIGDHPAPDRRGAIAATKAKHND